MRNLMLFFALAVAALSFESASAQTIVYKPTNVLVCDTKEQMEDLVRGGADAAALRVIIHKAGGIPVCGQMALSVVETKEVSMIRHEDESYSIVKIHAIRMDPQGRIYFFIFFAAKKAGLNI